MFIYIFVLNRCKNWFCKNTMSYSIATPAELLSHFGHKTIVATDAMMGEDGSTRIPGVRDEYLTFENYSERIDMEGVPRPWRNFVASIYKYHAPGEPKTPRNPMLFNSVRRFLDNRTFLPTGLNTWLKNTLVEHQVPLAPVGDPTLKRPRTVDLTGGSDEDEPDQKRDEKGETILVCVDGISEKPIGVDDKGFPKPNDDIVFVVPDGDTKVYVYQKETFEAWMNAPNPPMLENEPIVPFDLVTEMVPLIGVDHTVNIIAWSPDGKYIAAAAFVKKDGWIQNWIYIWDVSTRNVIISHAERSTEIQIHSLEWSRDSKKLLTAGPDNSVFIWTLLFDKKIMEKQEFDRLNKDVTVATWSPDMRYIASSTKNSGKIFISTASEKELVIEIFELPIGKNKYDYDYEADEKKERRYLDQSIASWSPDNKLFVGMTTYSKFTIYDVTKNYSYIRQLPNMGYVEKVSWSPDGKRLAAAAEGRFHVYEMTYPYKVLYKSPTTYGRNYVDAMRVSWSPDGKYLLYTKAGYSLQMYDATTYTRVVLIPLFPTRINTFSWSPDSKSFVTGHIGTKKYPVVRVWDVDVVLEKYPE